MDLEKIRKYAQECYDGANCKYGDNEDYSIHIYMVSTTVKAFQNVFKDNFDYLNTLGASYCHDLLEDTKESYNDICKVTGKEVADITFEVTDVPADNRLMKHLLTMHKTVKDYRAIILKMCDIYANAKYSKEHDNSMYKKYVKEYAYRRPIFKMALEWYKDYLVQDELDVLWKELDEIHGFIN